MKIIKGLIVLVILTCISSIVILITGKTYTVKLNNIDYISSVDELQLEINNENTVKCIDKKIENGVISLKFESASEGKTSISIIDKGDNIIKTVYFYVHKAGIITTKEYFGNCTGDIIIPISITVWIGYIILLAIQKYKEEINKNLYQYKNVTYLGLIIFLIFAFINQIVTITNYQGLIYTIREIMGLCSTFSILLLPIAFIVSMLVTISNIKLVKKEGLNIKNLLGLILGVFFCFTTIAPYLLNDMLQTATWIDVHNENGIATYIQNFIEITIYVIVTYFECILIGSIILGIKSAKRIPKYDKDYIIILGCQMREDGTLTNLLKGRVDKAIEFSKMQKENTNKDIIFVPSGGKGRNEVIAEADAMKNYLLEQGIKEENILVEDKSKNTFENIKFSNELIKERMEKAKIALSTTNYHVFRAGCIASDQKINIEGIGAKTKRYFWINAFIREFIATVFAERKKHIIIIGIIIIASVFMIGITYFNNNI